MLSTTRPRHCWPVAAVVAALLLGACGGTDPLSLDIVPDESVEQLGDVSRLDYRVFIVGEVDQVLAEATNPDGTPVTGVSCDVIESVAPGATGCFEVERRVLEDRELLDSGDVPASGTIDVERSGDVRVYVELPGDQLRVDEHGHICRWSAAQVVPADEDSSVIRVLPAC